MTKPIDQRVGDAMSRAPRTLGRNDRLRAADDLMNAERYRYLPVLDERGRLVGILSQRALFQSALLRALRYGSRARDSVLESVVVKEVMTDQVQTTTPDTALAYAARLMYERKIGCLPVVENGALVGIRWSIRTAPRCSKGRWAGGTAVWSGSAAPGTVARAVATPICG